MRPILSVLVIIVSIGVYFFYIEPLTLEVRVQLAKKNEIERVLNRVREIKEKRDAVLSDYNSISEEDIKKLEKILPENINSVVILNDLNSVASQFGLVIKEYKADEVINNNNSVSDGGPGDPYKKTKIIINVEGSYGQFLNFLTALESSLSIMDVVFLNIKGSEGNVSIASPLQYTLEANVYSLK